MLKAQKIKWIQRYLSASYTNTFPNPFRTEFPSSLLSAIWDTLIYHTRLLQHALAEFYEDILSFLFKFEINAKCFDWIF